MIVRALLVLALVALLPAAAVANNPMLTVTESELGTWDFEGLAAVPVVLEVTADTNLNFSWLGDASGYGGVILGYRYGWDVVDPDDPVDPGWATSGYVADLLFAPPVSFSQGLHILYVEVVDAAGGLTRAWFYLDIGSVGASAAKSWGHVKSTFRP
jgi:hypothetical protein